MPYEKRGDHIAIGSGNGLGIAKNRSFEAMDLLGKMETQVLQEPRVIPNYLSNFGSVSEAEWFCRWIICMHEEIRHRRRLFKA